jgi:hypothetical protein
MIESRGDIAATNGKFSVKSSHRWCHLPTITIFELKWKQSEMMHFMLKTIDYNMTIELFYLATTILKLFIPYHMKL